MLGIFREAAVRDIAKLNIEGGGVVYGYKEICRGQGLQSF